jgi:hypothetical protein
MPVFPSHLTVAHIGHQPQAIAGHFGDFLSISADLGEAWIGLYNGPRCGASAPDHLHFQALPRGRLPIEQVLCEPTKPCLVVQTMDTLVSVINDLGRDMIVLDGQNQQSLISVFMKIFASLKTFNSTEDEPMMNIATFHDGESWRVALFPRKKHRPDAFFREGEARVVVSPGVVEMAGVLITPMERDFERFNAKTVEALYREVSLDSDIITRVIESLR